MCPIEWATLFYCVVGATVAGLIVFHVAAAYYHLRYYVRRREDAESWKCQPDRWLKPGQNREALIRSSANLTLGGVITGLLIYAMTQGWETPVYTDVAEHGWTYTILSTPLLFVLNDAGAYYIHRALHLPALYKRIHLYHHRFIATSPYVTTAAHPFELLALQLSSFLPLFFIPFHAVSIGVVLVYILVFNIIDHSGVSLQSSLPWQGPSTYHDDHHRHFHCNFGQHLMLWDRLHGTLRRQHYRYGVNVFGGKGKATQGHEDAPFVDY